MTEYQKIFKVFICTLLFVCLFGLAQTSCHLNLKQTATPESDWFYEALNAEERGNYKKSFEIFKSVAEKGGPEAQVRLGYMYDIGIGVTQDNTQAMNLYRKAAEQGDHKAQNNLGKMYAQGREITQDFVQAYIWFDLAAWKSEGEEIHTTATHNREIISKKMTPDQIAEAQRRVREWVNKHQKKQFHPSGNLENQPRTTNSNLHQWYHLQADRSDGNFSLSRTLFASKYSQIKSL